MNFTLVVTRAFADYKVGDQITDQLVVAEILNTTNSANVVKTAMAPTLN